MGGGGGGDGERGKNKTNGRRGETKISERKVREGNRKREKKGPQEVCWFHC